MRIDIAVVIEAIKFIKKVNMVETCFKAEVACI